MDSGRIIDGEADYACPHGPDSTPRFHSETGPAYIPPAPSKGLLTHIPRLVPYGRGNKIPTSLLHDREHPVNLIQDNLLIFFSLMFSL